MCLCGVISVKIGKGEVNKTMPCKPDNVGVTGAIAPKILQSHSFLARHPSAKFRPNRFSSEEIYAKMSRKIIYIIGVKPISFMRQQMASRVDNDLQGVP